MVKYDISLTSMIEDQIKARGIKNSSVLNAIAHVPRHLFVPESWRPHAYEDHPLPIGFGQTISQPYIVALMTEALEVKPHHTVLEVGTGSGYQAAILSLLAQKVITIERIAPLWKTSQENLKAYPNVLCLLGDGYEGYPKEAPFDRILLTAAPEKMPETLLQQLKIGGIAVAPIGKGYQQLLRYIRKGPSSWKEEYICDVIFVPMLPSIQE